MALSYLSSERRPSSVAKRSAWKPLTPQRARSVLHGMLRSSGKMASASYLSRRSAGKRFRLAWMVSLAERSRRSGVSSGSKARRPTLVESSVDEVKRLGQRVALVDAEGQLRGDEVDQQGPSAKAVDGQ